MNQGLTDNQPSRLPGVDAVLRAESVQLLLEFWGRAWVRDAIRAVQAEARGAAVAKREDGARGEDDAWITDPNAYVPALTAHLQTHAPQPYRTAFNLTGTLIHTNLGRAPLSAEMMAAATRAATSPMTLEYDIKAGRRGKREAGVAARLAALTGAEAATLVNNNAAAVLLVLNTFARGKEVPVSRGELIEIGGSFRIPAIMERAGCTLREVGTTNRTHEADYQDAINASTAMLLKVHPSNYHIEGFTKEVDIKALARIAHANDLPVCTDLGSGTLVDLRRFGLPYEPTPMDNIRDGADLVTFSGDKLLGSVQAGLIVGNRDLIAEIDANPMKRALRLDKLALAIIEYTLKLYEDPDSLVQAVPVLRLMTAKEKQLEHRARVVAQFLEATFATARISADIDTADAECQLGSGALPNHRLPSRCVRIANATLTASDGTATSINSRDLAAALRQLNPSVIGRVQDNAVTLDMRGAEDLEGLEATLGQFAGIMAQRGWQQA